MATQSGLSTDRWYFTKDQIIGSVSSKKGVPTSKETNYRQQSALLIQEMGQKLKVNQLCINTAIVYMHRFFMCHPFTLFHRHKIAKACIFLSAKVEEQPRKLEHVINTAHYIINTTNSTSNSSRSYIPLDPIKEEYKNELEQLVRNETVILQTLGFEVTVDHPHTHVVRAVQHLKVIKCPSNDNGVTDLAKLSYFMATESLHLTTFCLQYKPNIVAAVCVHIACKWAKYELAHPDPLKDWWQLLGPDITIELLNEIATEFIGIIEVTPTKLKRMLNHGGSNSSRSVAPRKGEAMKRPRPEDNSYHEQYTHSRSNHQQTSHSMEKAVSDKLDVLIGSTKHSEHRNDHHKSNNVSHHHGGVDGKHKFTDSGGGTTTNQHSEQQPNKKPRTEKTLEQYKKLEGRMRKEQLDSNKQDRYNVSSLKSEKVDGGPPPHVKSIKSDESPPPPPPPPLQRAPIPQFGGLRYNLPPPLHNMARDGRNRNSD